MRYFLTVDGKCLAGVCIQESWMKKLKCWVVFFLHKFSEGSSFVISAIVLKEKVIPPIFSIVVDTFFVAISV